MRRIVLALVLGFSMVGMLAAVAQAAGQPPTTGDPTTTFTKTADVRVAMQDGTSLDTDEYVPDHGCPCPVVLVQTPYRKSDAAVGEYNSYFPSHGYAEIVVDVRGTGSSEGYWTSFGPPEQHDGGELVRWAVHRPFSNGSVALAGVSYSAINQFLTVEQLAKPEFQDIRGAVKAIFPIVPMSDPYRDVVFAGGNTDTGFIPLWLGLVNGLNAVPADDAPSQPAIALNVESQHLMDVATFAVPAVGDATLGAYEHLLPGQAQTYPDQAYDGAYYQTVAPITRINDVHVPTFIVGGEYDIFQRGEPVLYRSLGLPTTQKKLLYGPWYHGSPTANLTADDGTSPVHDRQGNLIPSTNNLSLAWFDHWVKGKANGIDTFPTVETYQIGRGAWNADSSFPSAGTTYVPWYLDGTPSGSGAKALFDGGVSRTPAASGSTMIPWQSLTGACSRSTAQWTAGIANVSQCSSDNSSAEATGASFTSAPFTSDYTLSGPIEANLWISSTRPDTTLVATVTDVHPDGTSDRVTAGSQVASLRAWNPTPCGRVVLDCTLYWGDVPVQPWHPYTRDSQQDLPSNTTAGNATGVPTELRVEIFPTSLVLQPGHRLRVSITTGDAPHQAPNASTTASSAGGVDTIYFGGSTPSAVWLGQSGGAPVAGGHATAASTGATIARPGAAAPQRALAPANSRPATIAARADAARVPVGPIATLAGIAALALLVVATARRASAP